MTYLMRRTPRIVAGLIAILTAGGLAVGLASAWPPAEEGAAATGVTQEKDDKQDKEGDKEKAVWAPAVEPKPLSPEVKRGLDWLVEHQLASGGWGQGEESMNMQGSSSIRVLSAMPPQLNAAPTQQRLISAEVRDGSPPASTEPLLESRPPTMVKPRTQEQSEGTQPEIAQSEIPSVADTCMAALALIRSGSTPKKGPYAKPIEKAVLYVCAEIEESDEESLRITNTQGTRVQSKLGPFIDTFMAAMLLPEVADKMPSKKENKRVEEALKKVLAKMEKNQREDGTWSDSGWAATLAQGAAVKGMNRAAQFGFAVSEETRERAEKNAAKAFDASSGNFSTEDAAGVSLYSASSNAGQLADSVNTNAKLEEQARKQAKEAKTEPERQEAAQQLERFEKTKTALQQQRQAVVSRLDDKDFIAGFGNNGGEEFLSYMNIGESLVVQGGDEWKTWDKSISENLNRVQNEDGSWSGHHCITGRTFCTSAALLVLMVDRAPFPVANEVRRR